MSRILTSATRAAGRIEDETPWTWANAVTAVRAVAGTVILAYAGWTGSESWNYVGLGVYWVLDILDGYLARRFDQETRLGAQADILADRLLMVMFYMNFLSLRPDSLLPVVLFLVNFLGVDHYLSNQFMRWPLRSPNYFAAVDARIWLLSWSPVAKALNTGFVTLLLVLAPVPWPAALVASALIGVKLYCCVRLHRLTPPERSWQALIPR